MIDRHEFVSYDFRRSNFHIFLGKLAREKQPTIHDATTGFPAKMISEKRGQKFHTQGCCLIGSQLPEVSVIYSNTQK